MPGPVSDAYDPEFGTAENAQLVADAIREQIERLDKVIGSDRLPILDVVRSEEWGHEKVFNVTERQARIMRFALHCALESI